jgi:nucleotide-binding universal stress UspA family protein
MNPDILPEPIYSIVVGIDYTDASALALAQAVTLARTHPRSHIHVLHARPGSPSLERTAEDVADTPATGPGIAAQQALEAAREMEAYVTKVLGKLDEGKPQARAHPVTSWTTHLRYSDPVSAIVQLAADISADLVVVGTHGRTGLARFLLGSVAEGVARVAPCPVLIVRQVGSEAAEQAPKIEPPCPACVEVRSATAGKQLWCERHSQHHAQAHTFHFSPFRDSHQSGLL